MSYYKYTRTQWNSLPTEGDAARRDSIWQGICKSLRLKKLRNTLWQSLAALSLAAAALAAGLVVGSHSLSRQPSVQEHFSTQLTASNTSSSLPDGTEVWLDSGSRLCYDESFRECRKVTLEGSASFNVVKTPDASTFEVQLDGASIIVHGTSFSVNQNKPDETVVTLYEGAVDFTTAQRTVSIEPGSSLTWNRNSDSVSTRPFFEGISWQDGSFRLREATLEVLLDFIRWRYDVQVYVAPQAAQGGRSLTGSVRNDESADSVIDKICYVMGLRSTREGSSYRLYK